MATKIEDLTSQVNGTTDTFTTTVEFVPSSLTLGYNGQIYPPGVNIKSSHPSSQTIVLDFIPKTDTDLNVKSKVLIIFEEALADAEEMVASAMPPV